MPPSGQLSHTSMSRSVSWARIVAITSLVVSCVALFMGIIFLPSHGDLRRLPYEVTGPGVVRFYNQEKHVLIHESDFGYVKMMEVCGVVPVWEKMHVNIRFHWANDGKPDNAGCYQIDGVQRLGPDY